ncbi:MAG: PP2C family protein-serine/threonine phosphatase [Thermoanaerobaculia bacterium]
MSSSVVHENESVRDGDKAARALYAMLELSKALSSEVDLEHIRTVVSEKASEVVEAEESRLLVLAEPPAERALVNTIIDGRAVLTAPVFDSKGGILGIIESRGKKSAPRFDRHDESLIRALATHVAVAMERTRLTEVNVENERHEESLRLANEIQMRMLPSGIVDLPASSPFAIRAHIRPARQVGGDLYDFFWDDQRLYFCIGDVTGKGIGAALVMAVTKTLFRAHASFEDDPAKVLSAANARLFEETDPSMFVTAFCGFLDLRDGRLLFSNAGHDRPLMILANRNVQPLESKSGLPLGVFPKFTYVVEERIMKPGQAVFLYTDGITDAVNRDEELFKLDRLRNVLERCATGDPSVVVPAVLASVDRFAEGTLQADDLTMLCVQYRGSR